MPDFGLGLLLWTQATSWDELSRAALRIDSAGFDHLWFYDHLYAPGLPDVPALEGWTLATAVLAQTERLRVGHLVLCNNFRHPAVLAKTTLARYRGASCGARYAEAVWAMQTKATQIF